MYRFVICSAVFVLTTMFPAVSYGTTIVGVAGTGRDCNAAGGPLLLPGQDTNCAVQLPSGTVQTAFAVNPFMTADTISNWHAPLPNTRWVTPSQFRSGSNATDAAVSTTGYQYEVYSDLSNVNLAELTDPKNPDVFPDNSHISLTWYADNQVFTISADDRFGNPLAVNLGELGAQQIQGDARIELEGKNIGDLMGPLTLRVTVINAPGLNLNPTGLDLNGDLVVPQVPEPASFALFGLGIAGLTGYRIMRSKRPWRTRRHSKS